MAYVQIESDDVRVIRSATLHGTLLLTSPFVALADGGGPREAAISMYDCQQISGGVNVSTGIHHLQLSSVRMLAQRIKEALELHPRVRK